MVNRIWTAFWITLFLSSCSDEPDVSEDLTTDVNRAGSVESSVEITHLDSARDLLTTRHKVWVRGTVYKTVQYQDTLPALGHELVQAASEQDGGQISNRPKEYEVYITVK